MVTLKELGIMDNSSRPWYRRRGWTLTWAILGLAAVAVVVDFPHLASKPQSAADGVGLVKTAAADAGPCSASITNAIVIYRKIDLGNPTAQQRSETPRLLQDDLVACSFADSSAYDLATLPLPRTLVNTQLAHLTTTLTAWAAPHGTAFVSDIITLIHHPGNKTASADLASQAKTMDALNAKAVSELAAASAQLHKPLPGVNLPNVQGILSGKIIPKSS